MLMVLVIFRLISLWFGSLNGNLHILIFIVSCCDDCVSSIMTCKSVPKREELNHKVSLGNDNLKKFATTIMVPSYSVEV